MMMTLDRPDTIIVVAPDLAGFYEFVKPRQEARGESIVILLDRRQGDRRQSPPAAEPASDVAEDRRRGDRRSQPAESARALMSVLGFTILHRTGRHYTA